MDHTEVHPSITSPLIDPPAEKTGKKSLAIRIILNFLIYLTCYLVFFILKKKGIIYDVNYIKFLPIMIAGWGLGSLLSKKFRIKPDHILLVRLKRYFISLVIALGTIAILLFEAELSISRIVVLGSLFATAFVEGFIEIIRSGFTFEQPEIEKRPVSYMLVIIDFVIITCILGFLYNIKIGFESFNENHILMILSTYICWLSAALMTHQFKPFKNPINIWAALGTQIKFYILIIALTAFISYFLQLPEFYRSLYMTSIVLYTLWSFIINLFFYIDKIPKKTDEIRSEFLRAYELKNPVLDPKVERAEREKYRIEGKFPSKSNPFLEIENMFFKEYPEVFSFLGKNLDLDSFNSERTHILRSADPYNINVWPDNHLELLINHHKLNDFRRINHYLIEVNKRLVDGGVFVSNFEPIKYRYKRFLKRYPFIIASTLYFIDFIWHRAAPKLPVLHKIFFAFTKGKNRALSLAEGLGRLYYCGFEVLDLKDLDNICYVIARKVKEPSLDENPSYSTVIKMRRVGKDGKPIYVYKLRTMHPYSEYLQEFIYKYSGLSNGDKFTDDFRVSSWGYFLRKYWIDELPMLINFLKGNVKLVGFRPISFQKFSLYDNEFRKRRIKYKPGLVPPFYVDLPNTLAELILSEEKYLDKFDKNSIKTDFIYFWKSFNNIVINGRRSS